MRNAKSYSTRITAESGLSLPEIMIGMAIMSLVVGVSMTSLQRFYHHTSKANLLIDLAAIKAEILQKTSCQRTLPAPCIAGNPIALRRDVPGVGFDILIPATGATLGRWSVKAVCRANGIEVRAAALTDVGRNALPNMTFDTTNPDFFHRDPASATGSTGGQMLLDWRHPKVTLFGSAPAGSGGSDSAFLCASSFAALRLRDPPCPAPEVMWGFNPDGSPRCRNPLPATESCPAGRKVQEIGSQGQVQSACLDPIVAASACPVGQKVERINQDGTFSCVVNIPLASQCPRGQKVVRNSPDGRVECGATIEDVSGCPPFQKIRQVLANGTKICETNVPVTSCPRPGDPADWLKVNGLNPDGSVKCEPNVVARNCPAGETAIGFNTDGSPVCRERVPATACPPGLVASGINANGTLVCRTVVPGDSCPAGQRMTALSGIGRPTCTNIAPNTVCAPGSKVIRLNPDGSVVCLSNMIANSCGAGQQIGAINPDGSVTCQATIDSGARICPSGQQMNGVNSDGSARCIPRVAGARSCPAGQVVSSLSSTGVITCAAVRMAGGNCSSGGALSGYDALGRPICYGGGGSSGEFSVRGNDDAECASYARMKCPNGSFMVGYEKRYRSGQDCAIWCRPFQ